MKVHGPEACGEGLFRRSLAAAIFFLLTGLCVAAEDWSPLNSSNRPSARCGHSMVDIEGKIYIFGGEDTTGIRNDLHVYDSQNNTWNPVSQSEPRPPARKDHRAWVYGQVMYIYGGVGASGEALYDIWLYDPAPNQWDEVTPTTGPAARSGMSAVRISNNQVLVYGGWAEDGSILSDLWEYDVSTNVWTEKTACDGGSVTDCARADHAAAALNNSLFIAGGWVPGPTGNGITSSTLIYEIATDSWRNAEGSAPAPFAEAATAVVDSDLWLAGGYGYDQTSGAGKKRWTWLFDLEKQQWRWMEDLPAPVRKMSMTGLDVLQAKHDHEEETASLLAFGGRGEQGLLDTTWYYGEGPCIPTAAHLCLVEGRFQVEVEWESAQGDSGSGQAQAITEDTGYFWFFSEDNVEIVVKVLDACGFQDRFWVFAAGLTNVEVTMTVTDLVAGFSEVYVNPQQTVFEPVQDTTTFDTCAAR